MSGPEHNIICRRLARALPGPSPKDRELWRPNLKKRPIISGTKDPYQHKSRQKYTFSFFTSAQPTSSLTPPFLAGLKPRNSSTIKSSTSSAIGLYVARTVEGASSGQRTMARSSMSRVFSGRGQGYLGGHGICICPTITHQSSTPFVVPTTTYWS